MSVLESLPQNRCLSTLADIRGNTYYNLVSRTKLWGGVKVSPILEFDRTRFGQIRREYAGRMSISGIQDKISVILKEGKLVPSSEQGEFILKPIPALEGFDFLSDVPANEHVTMQIAAQMFGISTAANGMVFFSDGMPAYVVRRFDYTADRSQKLHQEDFCQLAGKSTDTTGQNYKYEFSYEEIGELLYQYCPAAKVEALKLFKLILFDYFIGNGDAHLKNFSLLESPHGDMFLSPAYDQVNTNLHLPHETRTALELFRDFETPEFGVNGFYTSADFRELANRFKIPSSQSNKIIEEFRSKQEKVKHMIQRSFLSEPAKERYREVIADRMRALKM